MKSVRPLCLAATLAALLLASAGPAAADNGIHSLWDGFSAISSPLFQGIESFWKYITGTDASDSAAVAKDGTRIDTEDTTETGTTTTITTAPGGGCVDPLGNPTPCPTNPKP